VTRKDLVWTSGWIMHQLALRILQSSEWSSIHSTRA